jgi:acyl-CoA thioesterase-1
MNPKLALLILLLSGIGIGMFVWFDSETAPNNLPSGPIIAIGDSIAAGVGDSQNMGIGVRLANKLDRESVNYGVAGETTTDLVRRLTNLNIAGDSIVVLSIGGNDIIQQVNPGVTQNNLENIIEVLATPERLVILLDNRPPFIAGNYRRVFEQIADSNNQVYLIPNALKEILGNPELSADPIHPNAEGYDLITQRIIAVLEQNFAL